MQYICLMMGFVSQLLKKSWADYSVNAVVSRLGEMSAFTSQTSSARLRLVSLGVTNPFIWVYRYWSLQMCVTRTLTQCSLTEGVVLLEVTI